MILTLNGFNFITNKHYIIWDAIKHYIQYAINVFSLLNIMYNIYNGRRYMYNQ